MPHEPTGSRLPVQQAHSKRCAACHQVKPQAAFSTTARGGPANSCRDCQRTASRLVSRRRAAAMRLLIAAHPEEWASLLCLVRGRRQVGATYPTGGGRGA